LKFELEVDDGWWKRREKGEHDFFRACLAGLRLLQKWLRLWLLWWSGFSGGVESF
jgi:hypothetical protein